MWDWLVTVFGEGFMPHGHCYLWSPSMVWLQVLSNLFIGLAYVSISATLYYIIRKIKDVPFSWMYFAFGVFIITCGGTHLVEVVTVWHPIYWFDGGLRAVTAVASVGTAFLLFPLVPKSIALADAAQQAHARGLELEVAYKDLAVAHERATQLEQAKTAFFANVSHELRTPLTLILGPLDRLLATTSLTPEAREELEVARRNAQTLLKHVNDLLDVSRVEVGRVEPTWARADLVEVVRAAASLFEGATRARGFALDVETPESVPAEVDVAMIERVVANLLSNAVKHVRARVSVGLRVDGGHALLRVEDDGPGIADDAKDAVFERFRQAEGSAAARIGGSGLGLAIARERVELHRGTIHVEDGASGGARFVVRLPLRAPEGATIAAAPARVPQLIEGEHAYPLTRAPALSGTDDESAPLVLIVEDHPDMRRHLSAIFAERHRVVAVADGAEALERLESLRPDLIVSDLMMPRVGGEELVRRVRAIPELALTPVLVLSARAEEQTRVAVLRAGANDYVMKPLAAEEVLTRGENLIERSRARELVAALRRAEAAARAKAAFLTLVSHEIRTPIAAIQVQLELVRRIEKGQLGDRFATSMQRMRRAVERLSSTLESVLEYANLQGGDARIELSPIDVAAIISVVVEHERAAAGGAIEVRTELPRGLPRVRGDERLVTIAVRNLVSNAIKHTDGPVTVRARRDGDRVRIEVEDRGPGIPEEQRAHIFLPFEQLEDLQHKHTPGLGLGLALVRLVHDTLNGAIEVRPTPGGGSTFVSTLPVAS